MRQIKRKLQKTPKASESLQKVVLLPMMQQYKRSIFCSRLVCFNETIAPLAKTCQGSDAFIWHEATSGRKDEDMSSAFHKFLLNKRDAKEITLWLGPEQKLDTHNNDD